MSLGFNGRPEPLNRTSFINEKGHTLHADDRPPSNLLLTPGVVGGGNSFVCVRQQRERETVLRGERGVGSYAIGADPHDLGTSGLQCRVLVPEAKIGRAS